MSRLPHCVAVVGEDRPLVFLSPVTKFVDVRRFVGTLVGGVLHLLSITGLGKLGNPQGPPPPDKQVSLLFATVKTLHGGGFTVWETGDELRDADE